VEHNNISTSQTGGLTQKQQQILAVLCKGDRRPANKAKKGEIEAIAASLGVSQKGTKQEIVEAVADYLNAYRAKKAPRLEVDASTPSPDRETEGRYKYKIGDVVETIVKIKRGTALSDRPKSEKRVIVDDYTFGIDEVATVPYSNHFDSLEYFTSQNPLTWQHKKGWQYSHTGHDIYWHQDRYRESLEKYRAEQDAIAQTTEPMKPTVANLFAGHEDIHQLPKKGDWKLELEATCSRYVEAQDLDSLIALAVDYFQGKGYDADYAGYCAGSWQVCVFGKNGILRGSLLFDALPNFSAPNENTEWLGGWRDLYWRPDEELESLIYDDMVRDLERLAEPLEAPPPNDFDSWLGDNKGNDDNFDFTTMEGFGVLATAH